MTGYAQSSIQVANILVYLELRSINHRFLDISQRVSEEFRPLEHQIRELLATKLQRGKIEFKMYIKENCQVNSETNLAIDHNKLNAYLKLIEQIQAKAPQLVPSTTCNVLLLPGVITTPENIKFDELYSMLLAEITKLCDSLRQNQQLEGAKLASLIIDKISAINTHVTRARQLLVEVTDKYKTKLKERLSEAVASIDVDQQRFMQEFAYFCQKIDVSEELDRLTTHTQQLANLLTTGGSIGKKADFISQEMLREANTFGSKSVALNTSECAIELKVLIEQIKEQIQNVL